MNNSFEEIKVLLEAIIKKTDNLSYEKKVSRIDLDIIMNDIRNLYQKFYDIDINNELLDVTLNEEIQVEKEDNSNNTIEIKKLEENIVIENDIPVKKSKKLPNDLFYVAETVTIADKFKDNQKSINEKIGQNNPELSIADKYKFDQKKDLKEFIGINEKFLFINELFDGNMNEYTEFINKINAFDNAQEAQDFINEIRSKKNWKSNLSSLTKLTELIENKFSS